MPVTIDESTHYVRLWEAFCVGEPSPDKYLHRFKRTQGLPRVDAVLGFLRGVQPSTLLDCGSGRGVFLMPLLGEFPKLPVTSIDVRTDYLEALVALKVGGINVHPFKMDIRSMTFPNKTFDVVTQLEVLEHITDPHLAIAEGLRVAKKFLVISVPSQPDDNPEHINYFTQKDMQSLICTSAERMHLPEPKTKFAYVRGHMLAIASLEH